jgi:hypothetical protein
LISTAVQTTYQKNLKREKVEEEAKRKFNRLSTLDFLSKLIQHYDPTRAPHS